MSIRYEGCENPGLTLDAMDAKLESAEKNRKLNILDAREYFAEIESGKRLMPEARTWEGAYASFDDYKKDILSTVEKWEADRQLSEEMSKGSFPECLKTMPDVVISGPVAQEKVNEVVDEMHRQFGTELAADYVAYLAACGTMSVCGIGVTGIDPLGEYDILDATREMPADLGIKQGYYPLSVIDSDRCSIRYFFQDKDGYVYGLLRDGTFMPACRSLQEYVAFLWVEARRGWI